MSEQKIFVYVGTYTRQDSLGGGQSEGIYIYQMDSDVCIKIKTK